jgi:hypothetical protein
MDRFHVLSGGKKVGSRSVPTSPRASFQCAKGGEDDFKSSEIAGSEESEEEEEEFFGEVCLALLKIRFSLLT